jgi:flagellar biosynthesis protein FliQ
MNSAQVTGLVHQTLVTALLVSAPLLLTGLVVGLVVSLFQTITSLQEQTLVFVPKILAAAGLLIFLLPWMIQIVVAYARPLFGGLSKFAG